MARARRTWTTMLAEIRRLLRETTASSSFWSDALLLDLFNQAIDLRVMDLAEAHEGWVTEITETNTVADQSEYTLPEGTGRVKRILLVFNPGTNNEYSVPLTRAERWSRPVAAKSNQFGDGGSIGSYRLVGELLYIEPAPGNSIVNGLRIESEIAPARLTAGSDKLDLAFPDVMETMLIYDTACAALAIEEAQGEAPAGRRTNDLTTLRDRYEVRFMSYIETRSYGRTFSEAYHLGD